VVIERKQAGRSDPEHDPVHLKVRSTPPVTLHINFEARQATLRHYIPFVQTDTDTLYLNPALDVVLLRHFPRQGSDPTRIRTVLSAVRYIYCPAMPVEETWALIEAATAGDLPHLGCIDFLQFRSIRRHSGGLRRAAWTRLCARPGCVLEGRANNWCLLPESQYTSGEVDALFRTCERVFRGMSAVTAEEMRKAESQAGAEHEGEEELLSFEVSHHPLHSYSFPRSF
jgi:hypothetical protein